MDITPKACATEIEMYLEICQNWKFQCIEELLWVEWISNPQKYLQNVYHVIEWYKEFLKNHSSTRETEKLILEFWTHLNKYIFKDNSWVSKSSMLNKICWRYYFNFMTFYFLPQKCVHIWCQTWPLYTNTELKFEDKSLGEEENISLLLYWAKGDTVG